MNESTARPRRRFPWVGIAVALAIALAIVAFALFGRRGARKPPPVPEEATAAVPPDSPG